MQMHNQKVGHCVGNILIRWRGGGHNCLGKHWLGHCFGISNPSVSHAVVSDSLRPHGL